MEHLNLGSHNHNQILGRQIVPQPLCTTISCNPIRLPVNFWLNKIRSYMLVVCAQVRNFPVMSSEQSKSLLYLMADLLFPPDDFN